MAFAISVLMPFCGKENVFRGRWFVFSELPLLSCIPTQGPGTRRSHTAVLHESSMFVFGGYIDMRGASDELWQYELGEYSS